MSHTGLETLITAAFEDRANITAETKGDVRGAVNGRCACWTRASRASPRRSKARPARKAGTVNQWLKKAVLLSFRLNDMAVIAGAPGGATWWDKIPSKFDGWTAARASRCGLSLRAGRIVRRSAYIAPGAF